MLYMERKGRLAGIFFHTNTSKLRTWELPPSAPMKSFACMVSPSVNTPETTSSF